MSNSEEEKSGGLGIDDEQLPDDLQPSDDNPLAEGLDDGETVDDLLDGGKTAEEKEGDEDYHEGEDSDSESDSGES